MAIKVFLKDVDSANYHGNPADRFEMIVPYRISISSGGPDGGPFGDEGQFQVSFPLDTSPAQVYAICYQKVLDLCVERGYETPAKTDIYTWLPTDFSVLIP